MTPAMKSQEFSITPDDHATHFRKRELARCPDCEARFPLQLVIAELLRKNQMLRMELQEARSRLPISEPG